MTDIQAQGAPLRGPVTHAFNGRQAIQDLLNAAHDGLCLIDDATQVIAANQSVATELGIPLDQLVGQNLLKLLPAQTAEVLQKRIAEAFSQQSRLCFETEQSQCFKQYCLRPLDQDETQSRQMVISWHDVTTRRQTEAELEAVYEHAPVIMCLLDEEHRILRVNRAALQLTGISVATVMGRRCGDLLGCQNGIKPVGDNLPQECEQCHLHKALTHTWETGESVDRMEFQVQMITTGPLPPKTVRASTAIIQIQGVRRLLLCLEDVTREHQAESQVREQAELLEVATDAIVVLDPDLQIQYWNHGAQRLYGWRAEQALSKHYCHLLFGDSRAEGLEAGAAALRTGYWTGELKQITSEGHPVIIQSRWTLVRDAQGQIKAILTVSNDVTENKRMEAQVLRAQRMENMGALGAGIAHDLNNILSPIIMTLPMLRERIQDQESQELIDMLSTNAQRATEIVKQMLAFSEGFQGERTLMDPRHLLRNLGQLILETFPKNIHLDMECEDDSWHIQADPTLIHQTLLNLCVNARDAMPQGGTLSIRMQNLVLDEYSVGLYAQAKPGNYIVITIADSGTGISPENLGRVFDPFFSTKGPGKGTGLGLATAHIIVKKHGGFFRVESALNRGTTFRIYLPALVEESDRLMVDHAEVPCGNNELILVIDDEAHVGEVVRRALTRFGYRVLVANDGTEALSQLSQHRQEVQLVISDIVMPGLDGQTTARILKNLKPDLKYMFMTGWTDPEKIAPEIAKGQVPLIHKPFNINLLLRKVHEIIQA